MHIGLLGSVSLSAAGREVDPGSTKERCLLAILALSPRIPVSADAIANRLWDSKLPLKARDDLYSYVARLRKTLNEVTGGRARLTAPSGGYVLDVEDEAIDLHLFRLKRRQARAMADSGDLSQAIVLLREAESLWRGEALAGLQGDWFAGMRRSLEEERRSAIIGRINFELDAGHHADLIGELWQLAAQYPLDEAIVAASMTALYRSGRATEALQRYRETHSSLIEQGMEPGAELVHLHRRMLDRDPALSITPAYRLPPDSGQPDTLPRTTEDFIGRADETSLLTINHAPGTPRLFIIEGLPGVGKTTLAVHAARSVAGQFPDAQLFIGFHTHGPGQPAGLGSALDELLQGLGIPASRIPASLTERVRLWRTELAGRRVVIVLDDVPDGEQIRPLLPDTASCLTLVTTRRRLGDLGGATALHLDVLSPADAARLFIQAAGAEKATGTDEVQLAVHLCGFLPLAIQIAGRQLRRGEPATLSELVEELSNYQQSPGAVGAISAQINSAFNASYLALSHGRQHLFRMLTAHPCPEFTAESTAALIAVPVATATAILDGLADDHLIEQRAKGRYRFHDLVRVYAAEQAAASDTEAERRQAAGRVLDYYLATTSEADVMLYPHRRRRALQNALRASETKTKPPDEVMAWLQTERPCLMHAARYAATRERKTYCTDLAHVLAGFLAAGGYWDEALTLHQLALQAARDLGDPAQTAQAQLELAQALQHRGRYDDALAHARRAAADFHAIDDQRGVAETLDRIGTVHDFSGRFLEALAYYGEAMNLYRAAGDLRGLADAVGHAGIAQASLGRMDLAVGDLNQALGLYRQIGDRRGEASTLSNLGEFQRRLGYYRDAVILYQQSAEIFAQIGGRRSQSLVNHNMGIVQHYRGHYDEALRSYRSALTTYRAIGDLRSQANAFNDIGITYQAKEQHAEALAHHQKAQQIAEEIGEQYELTVALRGIGDAHAARGNYTEAGRHYATARRLARETGCPYQEAKTIARIAEAALQTEGPEAARIHLRQALIIFDQLGVPESEQTRIRLDFLSPPTTAK